MSSYDSIKITYCLIRVKSNGCIEQQGEVLTAPSSVDYTLYFPVSFTVKDYFINFKTMGSDRSGRDFQIINYSTDVKPNFIKIRQYPATAEFNWFCKGY